MDHVGRQQLGRTDMPLQSSRYANARFHGLDKARHFDRGISLGNTLTHQKFVITLQVFSPWSLGPCIDNLSRDQSRLTGSTRPTTTFIGQVNGTTQSSVQYFLPFVRIKMMCAVSGIDLYFHSAVSPLKPSKRNVVTDTEHSGIETDVPVQQLWTSPIHGDGVVDLPYSEQLGLTSILRCLEDLYRADRFGLLLGLVLFNVI